MNKLHGFTLIELLVVVLIVGILSAVALPQYQKAVDKARFSELLGLVNSLKQAEDMYYLANGVYAKNYEELQWDKPGNYTVTASGFTINSPGNKVFLNIMDGGVNPYVYGLHKDLNVSYVYNFDGTRYCYSYDASNARSNGLCASVGKFYDTFPSSGNCASAGCNRYIL